MSRGFAGPAGIGGTWVKPLTLRWVHSIHEQLGIPIAGSNGVFDHRDVVEFIMAGAGIVQVGSILMLKGIKWLPRIIQGVEKFMDQHGYDSVADMHGIASRRAAKDYAEQFAKDRLYARIKHDTCKNPTCNICIQICFYEALSQDPAGKINVHPESCIGCELCLDVCPFDSIEMARTSEGQLAEGYFDIPAGIYEKDKFVTTRNNPDTIRRDAPRPADAAD